MAASGRHRRYQPSRINRASLTVTVGGVGIVLPLITAASAGAASTDVWEKVAVCESTSSWHINTGNGHYGGLQFTLSTWEAYGGTVYAPRADLATKDQQIAIAEKVLEGQGPGAWPGCSVDAGLTRGAGTPDFVPQTQRSKPADAARTTAKAVPKAAVATPREEPRTESASATPTVLPDGSGSYTVERGDSLSAIAAAEQLKGGWQRLYAANRTVVGDDPDLIIPGQRLSLEAAARTARIAPAESGADSRAAGPKAESRVQPRAESKAEPKADSRTQPKADSKAESKTQPKAESKAPQRAPQRPAVKQSAAPEAKPKQTVRPEPKRPEPKKQAVKKESRSDRSSPERSEKRSGFTAPVSARTGTPYHQSGSWSSGYHTGVDFPVPTGTSVNAVTSGKIVSAGWAGAYGYEVVIRHADGRYSQYAHLSALHVREGQQVSSGQRIARSGSTGNSTGPHLHFEIRTGPGYGSDVDPLAYLRAGGLNV